MRKLGVDELTPKHRKEIFSLAKEWWGEISPIPLIYEDVERFFDMNITGVWVDKNDNVIGYYILAIIPHPFNLGYTIGEVMSMVIDKKYRGSTLFYKIMKDIMYKCYINKVDELYFSDTVQRPLYSVMNKMDFEKVGTKYYRRFY